jgi:hypothetical protein
METREESEGWTSWQLSDLAAKWGVAAEQIIAVVANISTW